MNKKAISISINFIVVIIFVIIVIGLFFLLFYSFIGQSESAKAALDKNYVNEVQRLVSEGEKVAVYPQNIETQAGKSTAVGVGILNKLGTNATFQINAECNATISSEKIIGNCPTPLPVSFAKQDVFLENNEQKIVPLVISMKNGIAGGTYIINVEVKIVGAASYDSMTHKVYVKV